MPFSKTGIYIAVGGGGPLKNGEYRMLNIPRWGSYTAYREYL